MNNIKIPVYQPSLTGNEKKYVNECLDSNWISSKGKFISLFEDEFSKYINIPHATTVSNGTVALHLALEALGIGPGDEVIVPTFTYVASVNAIAYVGAKPVFVDSLEDTWQLDPNDVKRKLTKSTKAIMAVHLYGHPCSMLELVEISKNNNLFLIEDCAEAFGSFYEDKHVGTFGDVSTFSFFGNKTITTGEGGMVVTPHKSLYERMLRLKSQGVAAHKQYWHDIVAYNYRMTNIQAAIGLAQLEQASNFLESKRRIADYYRNNLKDIPITFHNEVGAVVHSYWMCSVILEKSEWRDELRQHLDSHGIETRPLFYPVHTMPMFSSNFEIHPVAEKLGVSGFNLPSWPGLSDDDLSYIVDKVKLFFEEK